MRNGDGSFLAGHSLFMAGLYEADVVEAFDVVETIKLTVMLGFRRVEVEGGESNIISSPQNNGLNLFSIRNLIEEARSIAVNLEVACFSVVRPDGNAVVHKLARHAKFSSYSIVWVDSTLSFFLMCCWHI